MAIERARKRKKSNVFETARELAPPKDKSSLSNDEVAQVLARRANAQSDMLMWKQLLTQAHRWATPNSNAWYNLYLPIVPPARNLGAPVADLTLVIAHRRLQSKILTGMIPKGTQWMRFVPGDRYQEGTDEYIQVQKMADLLTEKFFNLLDRSRFYLSSSEAMSDALISTGFMCINEGTKEDPFIIYSVSDALVMIEGNAMGGVCGLFRDWKMVLVAEIPHIWKDAILPPGNDKKDKINIYECSYIDWDADEAERYVYAVITENAEVLYVARDASGLWCSLVKTVVVGHRLKQPPPLQRLTKQFKMR